MSTYREKHLRYLTIVRLSDKLLGWNWFSVNRQPSPPDIASVLSSIAGKFDRLLGDGCMYIPGSSYNTCTTIEAGRTYMIHMIASAMEPTPLVVRGQLVPADIPMWMSRGWHWLGYLPTCCIDIPTALSSVAGKFDLLLGADCTYAPDSLYNTCTAMCPGEGYLLSLIHI